MPKDKSEKKEKKSKTVTEKVSESIVTGGDVEMEDVTVAKVSSLKLRFSEMALSSPRSKRRRRR